MKDYIKHDVNIKRRIDRPYQVFRKNLLQLENIAYIVTVSHSCLLTLMLLLTL